jgi:hypothetical protein
MGVMRILPVVPIRHPAVMTGVARTSDACGGRRRHVISARPMQALPAIAWFHDTAIQMSETIAVCIHPEPDPPSETSAAPVM